MDFDRDELLDISPKDEIVEMITQEINRYRRRLGELKDQIDSMQNSVEREQNRYSSIATELRSVKENLDTTPREDIRDKYEEALDVRFRLATMRGQLEKFESIYEYYQNQQDLLTQVITKLQGVDSFGADGDVGDIGSGGLDIISIINAQEDERKRLARTMHDGPAQSLTNFILQAEICQRLFERAPDRAGEELDNLKDNASRTFQKIRDFIFDLRPMMLEDLGIAPTVRRYVESYKDKSEIDVKLDIHGDERRYNDYIEVMIFRSIQDVMSAARDYANPTSLGIDLDLSGVTIRVNIKDNGQGFDAENLFDNEDEGYSDARAEAFKMVKGKLELIGGEIAVSSSESEGTEVRMDIPTENDMT